MDNFELAKGHFLDGLSLLKRQDYVAAEEKFRGALALMPERVSVLVNLAGTLIKLGKFAEAKALASKAVAIDDQDLDGWMNLGICLFAEVQFDQALASYEQAIKIDPDYAQAHYYRGNVLNELRKFMAALQSYDKAIALKPDYAEAFNSRGNALQDLNHLEAAVQSYDQAIALIPNYAEAYGNRGIALRALKRWDDALISYDRAIAFKPDFASAYSNRSNLLIFIGEKDKALQDLKQAIRLDPESAVYRLKHLVGQIPVIAMNKEESSRSRELFLAEAESLSRWLDRTDIDDGQEAVGSAQPFYLAYQEENNKALLLAYGAISSNLMQRWRRNNGQGPTKALRASTPKIRVGIASAHIKSHPVWNAFLKGWVAQLDKSAFEIHIYHLSADADDETNFARVRATYFECGSRSLKQWIDQIESDQIAVMIYPDLGMDVMAVQLASLRLAKVQVAAWGHPETTGLATIDYYISASDFEPAESQEYYSERLVKLPNLGCYYDSPLLPAADVDLETFGVEPGQVVFLCAGTPYKYAPEHDAVFTEIARQLPGARFMFFSYFESPLLSQKLFERLRARFGEEGMEFSRHAIMVPWQGRSMFHGMMKKADVFLDTIGFSGFNTAMQAIECGLPIVTCEGRFMRGRFASAILKRLQLDELVSSDAQSYVACAVRLARDPSCRRAIRARIEQSRNLLYRDPAVIVAMEKLLREISVLNTTHRAQT